MSGADFLDTNVLVYSVDAAHPEKQALAMQVVADAIGSGSGVVSFQVVQEALQIVKRKFKVTLEEADVASFFHGTLVPMWRVQPSVALYEKTLSVQSRYGFAFYDSLIVASALGAGCRRLLSEDLQHGQRIEGLRIENPFKA